MPRDTVRAHAARRSRETAVRRPALHWPVEQRWVHAMAPARAASPGSPAAGSVLGMVAHGRVAAARVAVARVEAPRVAAPRAAAARGAVARSSRRLARGLGVVRR